MSDLSDLDPAALSALADHVGRLKHDLGKYIAFQVRWVSAEAPLDERRAALASDLLATRRGPDGAVDAPTVWRGMRAAFVGEVPLVAGVVVDLSTDGSFRALDAAMNEVAAVVDALREGGDDDALVARGTGAAFAVADACRDLHRRVRSLRGA